MGKKKKKKSSKAHEIDNNYDTDQDGGGGGTNVAQSIAQKLASKHQRNSAPSNNNSGNSLTNYDTNDSDKYTSSEDEEAQNQEILAKTTPLTQRNQKSLEKKFITSSVATFVQVTAAPKKKKSKPQKNTSSPSPSNANAQKQQQEKRRRKRQGTSIGRTGGGGIVRMSLKHMQQLGYKLDDVVLLLHLVYQPTIPSKSKNKNHVSEAKEEDDGVESQGVKCLFAALCRVRPVDKPPPSFSSPQRQQQHSKTKTPRSSSSKGKKNNIHKSTPRNSRKYGNITQEEVQEEDGQVSIYLQPPSLQREYVSACYTVLAQDATKTPTSAHANARPSSTTTPMTSPQLAVSENQTPLSSTYSTLNTTTNSNHTPHTLQTNTPYAATSITSPEPFSFARAKLDHIQRRNQVAELQKKQVEEMEYKQEVVLSPRTLFGASALPGGNKADTDEAQKEDEKAWMERTVLVPLQTRNHHPTSADLVQKLRRLLLVKTQEIVLQPHIFTPVSQRDSLEWCTPPSSSSCRRNVGSELLQTPTSISNSATRGGNTGGGTMSPWTHSSPYASLSPAPLAGTSTPIPPPILQVEALTETEKQVWMHLARQALSRHLASDEDYLEMVEEEGSGQAKKTLDKEDLSSTSMPPPASALPCVCKDEVVRVPFRGLMYGFIISGIVPAQMTSSGDHETHEDKLLCSSMSRLTLHETQNGTGETTVAEDAKDKPENTQWSLEKDEYHDADAWIAKFVCHEKRKRWHDGSVIHETDEKVELELEANQKDELLTGRLCPKLYIMPDNVQITLTSLDESNTMKETKNDDDVKNVSRLLQNHCTLRDNSNNNVDSNTIAEGMIQVAGLNHVLEELEAALLPPLLQPHLFAAGTNASTSKKMTTRAPRGVLLYGSTGVGKTALARDICARLSAGQDRFISGNSFSGEAYVVNNGNVGGKDSDRVRKKIYVNMVHCSHFTSSFVGEAERRLTALFHEAEEQDRVNSGCSTLLVLDDVHLICPRRGTGGASSATDRVAATLLALMDGLGGNTTTTNGSAIGKSGITTRTVKGNVVILAITSNPSLLDPALRRPGRLDCEVEIPIPDDAARADILALQLRQNCGEDAVNASKIVSREQLLQLAKLAKGFTGADTMLAVKEAARQALLRQVQASPSDSNLTTISSLKGRNNNNQTAPSITFTYEDLRHAISRTNPSSIVGIAVEVPTVRWTDIGGMHHVKRLLREAVELPSTHSHLFASLGISPPRGVLLYGPPGCSKTLMARALATEGHMNFLAVKGPELLSKWLGESERTLAALFRRARQAAPCVIFFDEVDAIASKRGGGDGGASTGGDRLLSQLLTELDGMQSASEKSRRVVVVGATNRPDLLDPALTRPGRIDRMIYVGIPDEESRQSILSIALKRKSCSKDVDICQLAGALTDGFSGAELVAMCRDAALAALEEEEHARTGQPAIAMRHIVQAAKMSKRGITPEMLQFYDRFRNC